MYKFVFNKKYKKSKARKRIKLRYIIILFWVVFYFNFFVLNLNSFINTIISFLIPTLIIYFERKDLIKQSVISGFLMVITAAIVYSVLEILAPGWINEFWFFVNVPEVIIFNLPIDDVVFYFLAAVFISMLYAYKENLSFNKQ